MTSPSATESVAAMSPEPARIRGIALASVLGALMLSLFLEALDQAIVGTALPRIITTLHGLDRYTWVVTAYVLATATMVPIVGKLSDQFGRKWFLVSGTVLFLIGSALAGMSQTMNQLIAFRAAQGLGAGIGIALVATVIGDLFPPDERGKLMGLFGLVYGVSSLLGPTLGGYLAEHGPLLGSFVTESTRWRWVFYFNLPIGAVAVAALVIFLPTNLSARTSAEASWAAVRHIDVLGAALSAAATICLLLGLTLASDHSMRGAGTGAATLLLVGALLFGLFVMAERRAADPILPFDLFRNQVFTASALLGLLQMMVMMALTIYLALFLQGALSISPTTTGLVMTSLTLAMVAGAVASGGIISAIKRYQVVAVAGAALMVVGAFLMTTMTTRTSLEQAIFSMIVIGLGTGVFFAVPTTAAQNALPASRLGIGTAATRYMGQVGASLGIAIVGAVVTGSISPTLLRRIPSTLAAKHALAGAVQHGFVAMLVFAILTLVVTAFLKDLPMVSAKKAEVVEVATDVAEQPELEESVA
ncbi:MAG TPA: MDR family MFS transporter [Ktedonobacterales bacterium]